jgi:hypothetical protein
MLVARSWTPFAAALVVAATDIACASSSREIGKPDPREECRASFAACAPPTRFDSSTDISKLAARDLVHVAARLDVPDTLAESAASRLRKIVAEAREPGLLEIEAALGDASRSLGRCSCNDGSRSELDEQGIAELVRGRLPPREQRSPEFWAERVLAHVAEIRQLTRSSAVLMAGGEAEGEFGGGGARDEQIGVLQRQLCIMVHAARASPAADTFAAMLDIVNSKEVAKAGEGSAAAVRKMIAEHEAASSCDPP